MAENRGYRCKWQLYIILRAENDHYILDFPGANFAATPKLANFNDQKEYDQTSQHSSWGTNSLVAVDHENSKRKLNLHSPVSPFGIRSRHVKIWPPVVFHGL